MPFRKEGAWVWFDLMPLPSGATAEVQNLSLSSNWSAKGGIKILVAWLGDSHKKTRTVLAYGFDSSKWLETEINTWLGEQNILRESLNARPIMHAEFKEILGKFVKRFGEKEGRTRFQRFVDSMEIDPTKSYVEQGRQRARQFTEAIAQACGWLKAPQIRYMRSDGSGKYYAASVLTAGRTANDVDYPLESIQKGGPSLAWRPISINHGRYLEYPKNRTQFVSMNDATLEATVRIDNSEAGVQADIEKGEILCCSIEAVEEVPGQGPDSGLVFLALSLLQKSHSLPGDVLSEVQPIVFAESIRPEICRLVDARIICGPCDQVELYALQESVSLLRKEVEALQRRVETPPKEIGQVERRLKQSLSIIKKAKKRPQQIFRDVPQP